MNRIRRVVRGVRAFVGAGLMYVGWLALPAGKLKRQIADALNDVVRS